MSIWSSVRKFLLHFDFFSSVELLRYNKEPEYRTLTGSILSIIIIGVFCVLFMNMAIKTVQRSLINYTADVSYTDQTDTVTFSGSAPSNFMFALELYGLDLSSSERYFDLIMYAQTYNKETLLESSQVPMEPCTADHFNMTEKLKGRYSQLGAKNWLCPRKDYEFTLQGKYTSQISQIVYISISKCTNQSDPSRPCVNQSVVDAMQAENNVFVFSCYFINALINPSSANYLDYYLNDLNYAEFTPTLGVKSYGYISQFDIVTDKSILPWAQNLQETGVIIDDVFQVQSEQVFDDTYVQFFIYKSGVMRSFERTYNKLDNFFSYIGGLFGAIMTGMLIMKSFTESAYELSIASRLYSSPSGGSLDIKSYNMLTHIVCKVYGWLTKFNIHPNWPQIKLYEDCMEEAVKQLDVRLLMQRITFMERALMVMFTDNQWKGLHLGGMLTLKQAERMRQPYRIRPIGNHPKKRKENKLKSLNQDNNINNGQLNVNQRFETLGSAELDKTNQQLENNMAPEPIAISINPRTQDDMAQDLVRYDESQKSQELPSDLYPAELKQNLRRLKIQAKHGNLISTKILAFVDSRDGYDNKEVDQINEKNEEQHTKREKNIQMNQYEDVKNKKPMKNRKQKAIKIKEEVDNDIKSDDCAGLPIQNVFKHQNQ